MRKRKRKATAKIRTKAVTVYARFERSQGVHLETWHGVTRNMITAMRHALLDFRDRPAVKFKHYHRISITAQTNKEVQS